MNSEWPIAWEWKEWPQEFSLNYFLPLVSLSMSDAREANRKRKLWSDTHWLTWSFISSDNFLTSQKSLVYSHKKIGKDGAKSSILKDSVIQHDAEARLTREKGTRHAY